MPDSAETIRHRFCPAVPAGRGEFSAGALVNLAGREPDLRRRNAGVGDFAVWAGEARVWRIVSPACNSGGNQALETTSPKRLEPDSADAEPAP